MTYTFDNKWPHSDESIFGWKYMSWESRRKYFGHPRTRKGMWKCIQELKKAYDKVNLQLDYSQNSDNDRLRSAEKAVSWLREAAVVNDRIAKESIYNLTAERDWLRQQVGEETYKKYVNEA